MWGVEDRPQVAGASEVLHLGCHPCKPGEWPLRASVSYSSIMRHPVSFASVSGTVFYPFDGTKSTWVFYVSLECPECGSKEFLALSVVRVLFQRSNMNCQAQPNTSHRPLLMLCWGDEMTGKIVFSDQGLGIVVLEPRTSDYKFLIPQWPHPLRNSSSTLSPVSHLSFLLVWIYNPLKVLGQEYFNTQVALFLSTHNLND